MILLLALGPENFSYGSRSRGVCVIHEFVKCTMIPSVKLELDSRANMFDISDGLDKLQD